MTVAVIFRRSDLADDKGLKPKARKPHARKRLKTWSNHVVPSTSFWYLQLHLSPDPRLQQVLLAQDTKRVRLQPACQIKLNP